MEYEEYNTLKKVFIDLLTPNLHIITIINSLHKLNIPCTQYKTYDAIYIQEWDIKHLEEILKQKNKRGLIIEVMD